jgi:Cu(I)/Ag(I) efflux system membrane fusion protein/cobalt-zinc-cadmium efflux system membrane fusion protein
MGLLKTVIWLPAAALVGGAGLVVGAGIGAHFHDQIGPRIERLGWKPAQDKDTAKTASTGDPSSPKLERQIYTCSMHPQVMLDHPGLCPICHMDLILATVQGSGTASRGSVTIDPAVIQNMGVRETMPMLGQLHQSIRAVGALTEPEQNHRSINLRVNGWIQKLYANQEGMAVNAGDPLFDLYSPEITSAADELITARKAADAATLNAGKEDALIAQSTRAILGAARRKLGLLGLMEEQVAAMEKLDKAPATITITSPMHGHIAAKNVIEGSAVMAGAELMKIADRSTMWLVVQVFERDLPTVRIGASARVTITALPGKEFNEGKVDFVYPHLDPSTRTAQVRIVLPNLEHTLHENMFGEAVIDGAPDQADGVLIPREALLDSGKRQIVFVDKGGGHFEGREVKVGRTGRTDDGKEMVRILSGITEQDSVVTSGQFLLDSESRITEAREKFLAPELQKEGTSDMGGMDMGGMNMGSEGGGK